MKSSRYYLAAFIAFLIWGFFSLALKPMHIYAPLDILFYRVFLCAALMLLITFVFRRKAWRENKELFRNMSHSEKRRTVVLTLGGGVLLTANWFFFIYVMNHISVKAAAFAYLVCPILTTVLAALLLKERLGKTQWIAVGLSALSCLLLGIGHLHDLFYSLVVASTYAFYLISQRRNAALDKMIILTFQIGCAALLLLPFYPHYSAAIPRVASFYSSIALIAVLFTIIPLFLNLYALKGVSSATMGIMIYVNPLVSFMLAIAYYNEQVSGTQLVAYSVILLSILLFNEKHLLRRRTQS
jgi:chloramphenicol-sensitive protein RarD